jgi:ubiquinone/menaquinone biosynthesis C-methylase UbiE
MEELTVNSQQIIALQSLLDKFLSDRTNIKVLEAGCGSYSYVSVPKEIAYIVGIDISEEQLQKNTVVHEKILGDIQRFPLPCAEFDVIVCWWVLEHLPHPEKALHNFLNSIKDGGLIVLAVPNVFSVKGLIAKYTPFWFHKWYYRMVFAGKGYMPFRTFLKFSISPMSLKRFATKHGLSIEYSCLYTPSKLKKALEKHKLMKAVWEIIRQPVRALSFGKIDLGLTEYILLLKK